MTPITTGVHHVAYRCHDAKQTVEFYQKYLNMPFVTAFSEDHVPSTGAYDPYMHVFLDAGRGNVLAFFELPTQPTMGSDPNTPDWVQHLALEVDSEDTLEAVKARLQADDIDVVGVTDHTLFRSIYFFDPNGHRIELTVSTPRPAIEAKLDEVKWAMLEEWSRTKRAPEHARFLHDGSVADD
jgi:lactoylglutathione lyase